MFKSLTLPGGERAVLLFHGLSSSPMELQFVARGLQRAGYTVYLPHLPGYGDDGRGARRHVTHWQDWVAQALHEFDRVRARHDQVIVGGLCIGATLAMQVAALRSQEVAAAVAMSITLWYDGWGLPWYRHLLPLLAVVPFGARYSYREGPPYGVKDERMRAWIAREMNDTRSSMAGAATLTATSLIEARRLYRATRAMLPHVEAPILIIHAVEDEMSSPRNAEYLARQVSAKHTRMVMLRDSYHMISLDREKDRVVREIRDFLSSMLDEARKVRATKGTVVPIVQTP